MAEAPHEVGAAVPVRRLVGLWLCGRCARRKVQGAPHRERELIVVGEAKRIRAIGLADRWQAAQERVDRVRILARDMGVVGIRKCRIEQPPVLRSSVVHGPPEVRGGPAADAGLEIRSEVGRVDPTEGSLDQSSAGVRRAAARGVAGDAVAGPRQILAAGDLLAACDEWLHRLVDGTFVADVEDIDARRGDDEQADQERNRQAKDSHAGPFSSDRCRTRGAAAARCVQPASRRQGLAGRQARWKRRGYRPP